MKVANALSEAIADAVRVLKEQGAREVYLFGSAATGRMHARSDVDIAVAGLPPERYFRAFDLAARVLDRPLSLIDLDDETPFTRYLKAQGELQRVG